MQFDLKVPTIHTPKPRTPQWLRNSMSYVTLRQVVRGELRSRTVFKQRSDPAGVRARRQVAGYLSTCHMLTNVVRSQFFKFFYDPTS